jgi:hypothetical protein
LFLLKACEPNGAEQREREREKDRKGERERERAWEVKPGENV